MLIWTIIALVLISILVALIFFFSTVLVDAFDQATGGQLGEMGELFGQYSELEDSMQQFENYGDTFNQFQGGGFGDLPIEQEYDKKTGGFLWHFVVNVGPKQTKV